MVVRAPAAAAPVAPAAGEKSDKPADKSAEAKTAAAPPVATAAPALSEAEIERITNLVKEAIGFDAARGDSVSITSAEFLAPPIPEALPEPPIWQQPWVWNVAKQLAGGLFVLLVLFGVIRPTVKSLMAKPLAAEGTAGFSALEGGAGGMPALAGPAGFGADGQPLALAHQRGDNGPLTASTDLDPNIDSIKHFVNSDPRVAAQVVKGWVAE